jgi:IS4 transposase
MQSSVRCLEVWIPEKNSTLVLISNLLHLSARTIAEIYRERWQIEVFFRALKQTLRVKTFVGTSANALKFRTFEPRLRLI